MTHDEARTLLGVRPDADDKELRRAYLEGERRSPPDLAPDLFEKVRDAYELLRAPRAGSVEFDWSARPTGFASLLEGPSERPFWEWSRGWPC